MSVEPERSSLVHHTAVMSVGTALSRATGFLRQVVAVAVLGITGTRLADAYNYANTTPNIVYDLVLGGILSAVFVPVFVEAQEARGRRQAWHSARAIVTFTVCLLSAITIVGMLLAGLIIHAYTFDVQRAGVEGLRSLGSYLLVFFMPQIVFYGLGAVWTGLLNANQRFAAPMFAPILNNLVVIATLVAFAVMTAGHQVTPEHISSVAKLTLGIGTTLGVVAMTLALWPSMRRTGFHWWFSLDLGDPALRRMIRLSGWIVVYVLASQLAFLVVARLAAPVQGGFSIYTYAYTVFQLPFAIFAVSIFTALLPSMSARWLERNVDAYRGLLAQGLSGMAYIVVPAALGYIALAAPLTRVLFLHGRATVEGTTLIAHTLVAFSAGLASFSAFQVLLRAFYAMQDARTPALINVVASALNAGVNVVFFRYFGVEGLALGLTTSYTFATVVALAVLRRRLRRIEGRRLSASLARIVVAAALAALAAWLAARAGAAVAGTGVFVADLVQVTLGIVVGTAVYAGLSAALRVEEFAMVKRVLLTRFGR